MAGCGSDGTGPTTRPPADTTPLPALRAVALTRGLRVGTAVDRLFRNDAEGTQFKTIAAREFSALTAENDMKHDRLQPVRGQFRYQRADSLVAFAEANGMLMRGHTLVWHQQNAIWLTSGSWTPQEVRTLLEDHITNVLTHFRGRIVAWDVVNEAFNDDGTRRSTFWSNNVGDYIDVAFRTARAADPQALLFYNDYNIEGSNAKSDSVYAMVRSMQQRGVPIDGVGFQGHFIVGQLPATMGDNIARFAALGLKIHITELDIRMPQPSTVAQQATQAENYRTVFDVCLRSTACQMIVTWGLTDKETWIPSVFNGWGEPLLFDTQYRPKIAYWSVHNFLSGR
jgi:endo-1,4-beta-xylanase